MSYRQWTSTFHSPFWWAGYLAWINEMQEWHVTSNIPNIPHYFDISYQQLTSNIHNSLWWAGHVSWLARSSSQQHNIPVLTYFFTFTYHHHQLIYSFTFRSTFHYNYFPLSPIIYIQLYISQHVHSLLLLHSHIKPPTKIICTPRDQSNSYQTELLNHHQKTHQSSHSPLNSTLPNLTSNPPTDQSQPNEPPTPATPTTPKAPLLRPLPSLPLATPTNYSSTDHAPNFPSTGHAPISPLPVMPPSATPW